ncbi:MAG: sigma-70 family RNA polymerase sigma factor [Sarcina sp.]
MRVNEKNFVKELKKQNPKALDYVVDKYSPLVNGIVRKVLVPLSDEGLIEECVYDVFLAVWNNISKFSGETEDFRKWLGGVSKFKAIDCYRKKSLDIGRLEYDEEFVVKTPSAEEVVIKNIDYERIVGLLNSCKEPDRSIFIMKFLMGMDSKEVANKMNFSISVVDTRVSRGRKKLKEKYDLVAMEG